MAINLRTAFNWHVPDGDEFLKNGVAAIQGLADDIAATITGINNKVGFKTTVCTSTTRPSSPGIGDMIYETDTYHRYIWTTLGIGATPRWSKLPGIPIQVGGNTMGSVATPAVNGTYQTWCSQVIPAHTPGILHLRMQGIAASSIAGAAATNMNLVYNGVTLPAGFVRLHNNSNAAPQFFYSTATVQSDGSSQTMILQGNPEAATWSMVTASWSAEVL